MLVRVAKVPVDPSKFIQVSWVDEVVPNVATVPCICWVLIELVTMLFIVVEVPDVNRAAQVSVPLKDPLPAPDTFSKVRMVAVVTVLVTEPTIEIDP